MPEKKSVLNLKKQGREPAPEVAPSNKFATKPPTPAAPEPTVTEDVSASQSSVVEEDDDVLDYFQKLAES